MGISAAQPAPRGLPANVTDVVDRTMAPAAVNNRLAEAVKNVDEAALQGGKFGPAAERVAHFLGTPKFLIGQTAVCAAWLAANSIPITINGKKLNHFDKYPFMALTLGLSLQAAYAAPFILLASRRQEARDKATSAVESARRDALTRAEFDHLGEQDKQMTQLFETTMTRLGAQEKSITALAETNRQLVDHVSRLEKVLLDAVKLR
ncbi:MAG TPA: DUF1003 domain-containing protein [Burkholderiaceae bacterium]